MVPMDENKLVINTLLSHELRCFELSDEAKGILTKWVKRFETRETVYSIRQVYNRESIFTSKKDVGSLKTMINNVKIFHKPYVLRAISNFIQSFTSYTCSLRFNCHYLFELLAYVVLKNSISDIHLQLLKRRTGEFV